MKPRTKLHHQIVELNKTLPNLLKDKNFVTWAYSKIGYNFVHSTKHQAVCFECGHKWERNYATELKNAVICPNCNSRLKFQDTKAYRRKDYEYCHILTVHGGFQVIRYFHVERNCYREIKAHYWIKEVCQHWISPNGKLIIMALKYQSFGAYRYIPWDWSSSMEIRNRTNSYYVSNSWPYKKKKYLKLILRNGFKGKYHEIFPSLLFSHILSNPKTEILLKTGQIYLLKALINGYNIQKINDYWNCIRIAIKHKYIIQDVFEWFDYLNLLEYFKKDIHNPIFICPKYIEFEHDKLVDKKRRIQKLEELERQKMRLKKDNEEYQKAKRKFFNLKISDGLINIVINKRVEDFIKEGDALNHCVYTNEYYLKNDSLILSARKKRTFVETIELSLKNFKILQARGKDNKNSEYHGQIMQLLRSNINIIKQTARV